MNNEPVAWMAVNGLNDSYSTFTNDQKQRLLPHISQCYSNWIPLYTHPAELTDEEIMEVITMSHSWIDGYPKKYALDFARAILRKAQEK